MENFRLSRFFPIIKSPQFLIIFFSIENSLFWDWEDFFLWKNYAQYLSRLISVENYLLCNLSRFFSSKKVPSGTWASPQFLYIFPPLLCRFFSTEKNLHISTVYKISPGTWAIFFLNLPRFWADFFLKISIEKSLHSPRAGFLIEKVSTVSEQFFSIEKISTIPEQSCFYRKKFPTFLSRFSFIEKSLHSSW